MAQVEEKIKEITGKAVAYTSGEPGRMSGEQRRQQIVQIALRLFSQKGFTGTTTKEIAQAAGVNEALIFRHFATKDDLYAAILACKAGEICSEDWIGELQEYAAQQDDYGLFHTIAKKRIAKFRSDKEHSFMRLMFYSSLEGHGLAHRFLEQHVRPIHEFLCAYIKRRQRDGAFRSIHPHIAVSGFMGMLNHYMMVNAFFEAWRFDLTDEQAAMQFTNLFIDGLRRESAAPVRKQKRSSSKTKTRKT